MAYPGGAFSTSLTSPTRHKFVRAYHFSLSTVKVKTGAYADVKVNDGERQTAGQRRIKTDRQRDR